MGGLIGPSLPFIGSTAPDLLLAAGGYVGSATPHSWIGAQFLAQGRDSRSKGTWDDILVGGRLAFYWKPSLAHTFEASTEYGLGLNQLLPFALTFSDPRGGIRGFHGSTVAGGERLVERLEDRWVVHSFKGLGDFGLAVFSDIGRMWAQGVPYGVNSNTTVGAGIGILAALPVRSKRIWRVDFAFPVTHDPHGSFEIRFTSTDHTAHFYIEPFDLSVARDRAIPTSIFEYPPL